MQVFMSHASVDKPVARKIRDALQRYGIQVWLDEAEIRVGQSIPAEIQRALQVSDVLCIILSASSANSKWVARELNSFLPFFVDGSRVLVPCRIDSAAIPTLIQDIKYADFTGSFETGVNELLDAVRIREQVLERKRLEALRDQIVTELSSDELQFLLKWTSEEIIYIEYDEEKENLNTPPELEKLTRLSLVQEYHTCRADVWYKPTEDGKAIQLLMGAVPSGQD